MTSLFLHGGFTMNRRREKLYDPNLNPNIGNELTSMEYGHHCMRKIRITYGERELKKRWQK